MANPQPIQVLANAGALTSEGTFYLDAGCDVVVCTAFLAWVPAPAIGGGPPLAGLSTFQLLWAFGSRLRTAPAPAVVGAVRGASAFTLRISAAAWGRAMAPDKGHATCSHVCPHKHESSERDVSQHVTCMAANLSRIMSVQLAG